MKKGKKGSYKKLFLMLALSFIAMYIAMFLNLFSINHFYFSATHFYMVLLMLAPMAVFMLVFMREMYPNKKANTLIIVLSILVFILALALLRNQTPIGDVQYLRDMIPHHSSALLASTEASLSDPEVRALAENIIQSQSREIEQMKSILARLK